MEGALPVSQAGVCVSADAIRPVRLFPLTRVSPTSADTALAMVLNVLPVMAGGDIAKLLTS